MALVSALAIGVGGAAGAVSRYAVGRAIERRGLDVFAVNVAGSFLFGIVLGADVGGPIAVALTVGFCGAFTTFASFALDTLRLAEDGLWSAAAANALGTLSVALVAVLAGGALGGAL